jgi:hypothetical protein
MPSLSHTLVEGLFRANRSLQLGIGPLNSLTNFLGKFNILMKSIREVIEMPIVVSTDVALRVLNDLIGRAGDLAPADATYPFDYQSWKGDVRNSVGMIFGTTSPEVRDIDDGFWRGEGMETSEENPPPNRQFATRIVTDILRNYVAALSSIIV